jgi:YbbR domain-containing protein
MRSRAIARFIAGNLGWILASLALALVIWLAARMETNPVEQDEIANVDVSVRLPEGYILGSPPEPDSVTAVVRAERSEWDLLLPSDILVTADLRDEVDRPGEYRAVLEAEVVAPLHGQVVALRPSSIVFQVDERAEERLPIQVVVSREPPLGYTYPRNLTCEQTEVLVSGSQARVDEVARVEARLNLSDDRNPITKTVNLTAVRENGQSVRTDIELTPASVECTIDIQVREGVTPVEVLPDRGGTNPPRGYIFEGYADIEPATVGVTGDQDAILGMNQVVKTAPIDLSERTETFTTELPLVLPEGVSLVTENQLVRVTVLISPVRSTREFQEVPVEVTGLDQTLYRATGLASTVTVNIGGPQLQLPDRDAVRAIVDLEGLPPGNHQVEPEAVIIGEGVEDLSVSITPELLNVTIEALNPTPTSPATAGPERNTTAPGITPTVTRPPGE